MLAKLFSKGPLFSDTVKVLESVFPIGTEVVAKKSTAEQHLKEALTIINDGDAIRKAEGAEKELASLCEKVAEYYLSVKKQYDVALKYVKEALKIKKVMYGGTPHLDVLKTYIFLSYLADKQKKNIQSLEYDKAAIEVGKALGPEGEAYLAKAYRNAASGLYRMDQEEEAIKYHLEAYKIRKRLYPKGHPELVVSCNGLAISYEALTIKEKVDLVKALEYGETAMRYYIEGAEVASAIGDVNQAKELQKNIDELLPHMEQLREDIAAKKALSLSVEVERPSGKDSLPKKDDQKVKVGHSSGSEGHLPKGGQKEEKDYLGKLIAEQEAAVAEMERDRDILRTADIKSAEFEGVFARKMASMRDNHSDTFAFIQREAQIEKMRNKLSESSSTSVSTPAPLSSPMQLGGVSGKQAYTTSSAYVSSKSTPAVYYSKGALPIYGSGMSQYVAVNNNKQQAHRE